MIGRFLPHLLAWPGALIVNVSSGLAFIPFPAAPVYSATKPRLDLEDAYRADPEPEGFRGD